MEEKSRELELEVEALRAKLAELESSLVISPSPFAPKNVQLEKEILEDSDEEKVDRNLQAKLPPAELPKFYPGEGVEFNAWLRAFQRWMRLTGVNRAPEKVKQDWIIQALDFRKNPLLEEVVLSEKTFAGTILKLQALFPTVENDIGLREKLARIPPLKFEPSPAEVEKLLVEFSSVCARFSEGALGQQEKVLALIGKIPPTMLKQLRAERGNRPLMENFVSLARLLRERAAEDTLERHLYNQQRLGERKAQQLHVLMEEENSQDPPAAKRPRERSFLEEKFSTGENYYSQENFPARPPFQHEKGRGRSPGGFQGSTLEGHRGPRGSQGSNLEGPRGPGGNWGSTLEPQRGQGRGKGSTFEAQGGKGRTKGSTFGGQKGQGLNLGKGKSKGGTFGKGSLEGTTSKPQFKAIIQCKYCYKVGHYEDDCWQKQKYERRKTKEDNPQETSSQEVFENRRKRKHENISFMKGMSSTLYLDFNVGDYPYEAVVDTGATCSALSSRMVDFEEVDTNYSTPVRLGNGDVIYSLGTTTLEVPLGRNIIPQTMMVLETDAFDCVLGMDFLNQPGVQGLMFRPARIVVNDDEVELREDSGSSLNYMFRMFHTESYKLSPEYRHNAIEKLGLNRSQVKVDLFATRKNAQELLFCTKENSAWQYDWSKLVEKDEEI
jgi:hypothetical protein